MLLITIIANIDKLNTMQFSQKIIISLHISVANVFNEETNSREARS